VGLLEEPTYRLYYCRRCGVQVQICLRCDHGNIYCAGECSRVARRECMRRAGTRYQRTLHGACHHAERQRRNEVTHQGCASITADCRVSIGTAIGRESIEVTETHCYKPQGTSAVRRVLTQAGIPAAEQSVRRSMADPFLPFIQEVLTRYPTLRASRLYHMVRERGYPGRPDHFRAIVARHRPRPPVEAYLRLRTLQGEQGQVDWAHFGTVSTCGGNWGGYLVAFKVSASGTCRHAGQTSAGALAIPNGTSRSYWPKNGTFGTPDCATASYTQTLLGGFGVN
jgi:hypothetical protein